MLKSSGGGEYIFTRKRDNFYKRILASKKAVSVSFEARVCVCVCVCVGVGAVSPEPHALQKYPSEWGQRVLRQTKAGGIYRQQNYSTRNRKDAV